MNSEGMLSGVWLWLAFLLIALATHLPRCSFILAGSRVRLPAGLQRALRYAPAAALSALVMPDIVLVGGALQPFNPQLFAALAVIFVTTKSRNPWLPFLVGMGILWLLKPVMGN